ncbi:MAG: NAD(P)H-binding protein [Spirochaetes bacterium]|nr:NAD(P)H-binding protein [Spirochaetota bacterium]MBU1079232.1 NAD(P)H-binding protein [Spirochaetota bacterium]
MNVFMVGGTGFLGYYTVRELIARGHAVSTIALPPMPAEGLLPPQVRCRLGNVFELSDDEILAMLAGQDGFMYAAGLDDRVIVDRPAYPKFREANVDQCMRLVGLARRAGVKKVVVYGSYFTYCDRMWPELDLTGRHCYIRSRDEQRTAALAASGDGMEVVVLELPYIFGTMPGRKPLWTFLVDILRGMGGTVYYPQKSGGTAMVTVSQVAKAAAGALERGEGGKSYPIGGVNMPWSEFIPLLLEGIGEGAGVVHLPKLLYKLGNLKMVLDHKKHGKEGGLDLIALAEIMYREAYIDPEPSMLALGYGHDDVKAAIRETVAECLADGPAASDERE